MASPDDPVAWVDLSSAEYDEIWGVVYADLAFRPSVDQDRWPSFREPAGSITWSVSSAVVDLERSESLVAGMLLAALDEVRGDDEGRVRPRLAAPELPLLPGQSVRPPSHVDSWPVPALPDGDYFLFLARDLRFGWLSHPWEQSVCVCGELRRVWRRRSERWGGNASVPDLV